MRHQFTDAQIVDAFYEVLMPQTARELAEGGAPRVEISDLVDMTNQLFSKTPDSPDGLAGERVEDPTTLQKGDRVQLTLRGDTKITGEIQDVMDFYDTQRHKETARIIFKDEITVGVWEIVETTRYPKPVTRPDPERHPVIIVHETGTVIWGERPAYWNPEAREYVFQDAFCTAFLPDEITDWEPAIIVPTAQKEVAEDDR